MGSARNAGFRFSASTAEMGKTPLRQRYHAVGRGIRQTGRGAVPSVLLDVAFDHFWTCPEDRSESESGERLT